MGLEFFTKLTCCKLVTKTYTSCDLPHTNNLSVAMHWYYRQEWEIDLSTPLLNQFFLFCSMAVEPLTDAKIIQILVFCMDFVGNVTNSDRRIVNNLINNLAK
jgi:hypothetical protein